VQEVDQVPVTVGSPVYRSITLGSQTAGEDTALLAAWNEET